MIASSLPTTLPAGGSRPPAVEPGPAGDQLAAVFAGLLTLLADAVPARPSALPGSANTLLPVQVGSGSGVATLLPAKPGALSPATGESRKGGPTLPAVFATATPADARQNSGKGSGKGSGVALPDGVTPFEWTPGPARPGLAGPLPPEEGPLTARTVGAPDLQLLPPTGETEAVSAPVRAGGEVVPQTRPTAPAATPPLPAAAQVHVQIVRAVHDRVDHIRVRLDPPELGHVEIRLDLGDDSRVRAIVTVDRADTLDLLQRDAASLERSLRDAGLRTDGGGLSFTLKRDQEGGGGGQAGHGGQGGVAADGEPHEAGPDLQPWRGLATGLLDISA